MSTSEIPVTGTPKKAKLPWMDWILLPGLGLLTLALLGVSMELIAMKLFPSEGSMRPCLVWDDRSTGVRGIPKCNCTEKIPEGDLVEYRFNSCGDYTSVECGPKPADTYRIVMTGTSFPVGLGVAREKTFAATLPIELSRLTGRKVELYNASLPRKTPRTVALDIDQMLAQKPDMFLWVINYSDIQLASVLAPADFVAENAMPRASEKFSTAPGAAPAFPSIAWIRMKAVLGVSTILHAVNSNWRETRSYVMLNHFIAVNESQSEYLKRNRTNESQYLDAEPSPGRLTHLKEFDGYVAEVMAHAKAAGVPVVAVFTPTRIVAALISKGEWSPDLDPYKLDEEMRAIVESHGGIYVDILPDYRTAPNPENGFYPADGHFNPEGHAMVTEFLARELTNGSVPGLTLGARAQAEAEQKR
jgi:hypothetical protein